MAAAPCSLVAVPTTTAPCCANVSAIARPMPRDAPVTRAVRPAMPGNFGSADRSIEPRRNRQGAGLYSRTPPTNDVRGRFGQQAARCAIKMGGDHDRPADRRGGERDGTDDLLEQQFPAEADRQRGAEHVAGEAASASAPAATNPCRTPDKPTYQSTAGSSTYSPRSIAAADARLARHQSPLRKTPSNSAPITTSAARFGQRCPKPRCTRCPETSRQYSPFSMASR